MGIGIYYHILVNSAKHQPRCVPALYEFEHWFTCHISCIQDLCHFLFCICLNMLNSSESILIVTVQIVLLALTNDIELTLFQRLQNVPT